MKKKALIISLICFIVISILIIIFIFCIDHKINENKELQVISLEMTNEYGDATLVKYGDYEILIDSGKPDDKDNLSNILKQYCNDNILEMLVVTHAHDDHLGGLSNDDVFENGNIEKVDKIIDFGYKYSTKSYRDYKSLIDKLVSSGAEYNSIYDVVNDKNIPDRYYLDSKVAYIEFYDTGRYYQSNETPKIDLNETSICSAVSFNDVVFLLTGDITMNYEDELIDDIKEKNKNLFKEEKTIVYKAAHHGSSGSNCSELLDFINPDIIFISSAITEDNRGINGITNKQHPQQDAVYRFTRFTEKIYYNGVNGTIVMTSNGEDVSIACAGRTIDYYYNKELVDAMEEKDKYYTESKMYKNN